MKIDWNRGWTFSKEGGQATKVTLPHDAMLGEQRDGSCRNGVNSGYFPGGKYIYEKNLRFLRRMWGNPWFSTLRVCIKTVRSQ